MTDQQQKVLELQTIEQQLQQLQQQLQAIQQQTLELTALTDSLDDLANLKPNAPMLASLGSGMFVSGELKDTQQVVMSVGAGVSVKKSIPEAKESVKKQLKELQDVSEKSQGHIQTLSLKARELQSELMAEQMKNAEKKGDTPQNPA